MKGVMSILKTLPTSTPSVAEFVGVLATVSVSQLVKVDEDGVDGGNCALFGEFFAPDAAREVRAGPAMACFNGYLVVLRHLRGLTGSLDETLVEYARFALCATSLFDEAHTQEEYLKSKLNMLRQIDGMNHLTVKL